MKKVVIILSFLLMIWANCIKSGIKLNAHEQMLNIEYDECDSDSNDKIWYYLCKENNSTETDQNYFHISHNKNTIKYYFSEIGIKDTSYTWTTDISEQLANEIKESFAKSMEKWNDVVYYSYDECGNRMANKVVNIIEGTQDDYDVLICPFSEYLGPAASTYHSDDGDLVEPIVDYTKHYHYNDWIIEVNILNFYDNNKNNLSKEELTVIMERTGAHEMGHILGLDDVDFWCAGDYVPHHNELLMGYGEIAEREKDITYQDIAGVSITRGFHTDEDHLWMKRINHTDTYDTVDLICALCNGVKKDVSINWQDNTYLGIPLYDYESCISHSINDESSNMLLVAKDDEYFFYKCKCCRYIEKIRHLDIIEIDSSYSINNNSNIKKEIKNIGPKESKYYKINSENKMNYEIKIDGSFEFGLRLYDSKFNEIEIRDFNEEELKTSTIIELDDEIYYLEIINYSEALNEISLDLISKNPITLLNGDNDILLNTYNNILVYNYFNDNGSGFYKFKITGSATNNVPIEFPEGCIKIYADSSRTILLDEVPFEGCEITETSKNLFAYLPVNGYYYIDIELDDYEYESLNFFIEQTECYNEVNYSNNNISDLIFYDYFTNKKYTTLKYYNNSGAGFYEFTVTGSATNNVPIEFPEGCIKIYADSSRTILLDEVPFEGCEITETSKNLFAYLPVNGYYYIDIELDDYEYESLNFFIEQTECYNEVNYSNNNISDLIFYDYFTNKKYTTLKYYNNSGAGFYEFTVTGSATNNVPIEFPEGCIKIYADSSRTILLDEVPFEVCEVVLTSNRLFACLPGNGYYYIDIELDDYEYESLNFSIEQTECYNEVNYSSNDILNLLHYDYSSNKKHTTLKYYNNSGAGFYEFKVTGSTTNNVPIEFPEGCIKIYADSSRTILLDEVPFEGCEAVSLSNRLFVYLPKNGYYYIEVELNNFDYRYLRFWIEQDEGYHLDLSNNLMSQSFVPLFENCDQDSYFKKVTISHRCTLILDALTNDIVSTDIPVIIFQQKYDKVLGNYYIETVFLNEMTSTNRGSEFEVILNAGNYYFGFIDNGNNVRITYAIERKINENVDINNTLVADPYESGCDVGSEVMFNNGSIREYTITEGFTRNLYLLFDGVPTQYSSRLDYDWYSSNNSVATVTAYGTVLGLNVEEDTEVTIYAIRKSDPSIIYKRTFTILNDFNEEIIELECDMSYSYSLKNGVYQLQLNSDNSPYPMIQYYSFEVHEWVQEGEFEVTLDYWGRVTATGPGACVIIGTYSLNPRVKIIINLVINE